MSVLSHNEVKIRKPRKCWGCTREFPKGSDMHRVVNRDGGLVTTYWCKECQEIINQMAKDDPHVVDDGFMRGELLEHIEREGAAI